MDLRGTVAADFGCSVGGFTDCLLQEGSARVYAVDTARGVLDWKLRQDDRVVVVEGTNAIHVELPEPVEVVAVDVGWTPQRHILPNALRQSKPGGVILSLFKPQYEAPARLVRRGLVSSEDFESVLSDAMEGLRGMGIVVREVVRLPHERKSKNPEAFLYIRPQDCCRPGESADDSRRE